MVTPAFSIVILVCTMDYLMTPFHNCIYIIEMWPNLLHINLHIRKERGDLVCIVVV